MHLIKWTVLTRKVSSPPKLQVSYELCQSFYRGWEEKGQRGRILLGKPVIRKKENIWDWKQDLISGNGKRIRRKKNRNQFIHAAPTEFSQRPLGSRSEKLIQFPVRNIPDPRKLDVVESDWLMLVSPLNTAGKSIRLIRLANQSATDEDLQGVEKKGCLNFNSLYAHYNVIERDSFTGMGLKHPVMSTIITLTL